MLGGWPGLARALNTRPPLWGGSLNNGLCEAHNAQMRPQMRTGIRGADWQSGLRRPNAMNARCCPRGRAAGPGQGWAHSGRGKEALKAAPPHLEGRGWAVVCGGMSKAGGGRGGAAFLFPKCKVATKRDCLGPSVPMLAER